MCMTREVNHLLVLSSVYQDGQMGLANIQLNIEGFEQSVPGEGHVSVL